MRKSAAFCALAFPLAACTGTTTSTIPATEIQALDADNKPVHSVWTTDGNVVDVAEPYALELRTKPRTANEPRLPDEVVLQGPLLAARTGTSLVIQECTRLPIETETACRPSAPEVVMPLASIESVSVHTREERSDPRSGPNPRGAWIAAVVLGSLVGVAAITAVIATSSGGMWGGVHR